MRRPFAVLPIIGALVGGGPVLAGHGIAMHGQPVWPVSSACLPYADPDAIKGGMLTQALVGTFDSLNPFIVKGIAAAGLREALYESLLKRSLDEPFSLYGLLAESVVVPADRSRVTFTLRSDIRFSDGHPITADDVEFSLTTLRDRGRPNYREYYSKVRRIERPAPRVITFVLDEAQRDRELPLILGLMPILPQHLHAQRPFDTTTLEPPVGSGPYKIESVDPGRRITYVRDTTYWGESLPVNCGTNNFDRLRFDYYRDDTSAFAALTAGQADLRLEQDATRWVKGYDVPAVRSGMIRKIELPHGRPSGMYGFVFNTRRPLFADPAVRRALIMLFDFDETNRLLLQGAYSRIESYFDNSDLAAKGPASAAERRLLAPYPDAVTPAILAHGWVPHPGGTPAAARAARQAALSALRKAGYVIRHGRLVQAATGAPFRFEILLADPTEERIALMYANTLAGAGIQAQVRTVDAAQYEHRRLNFDFEMTTFRWSGTLSPGNEQWYRWGSGVSDAPGSYNVAGVRSSTVDAMIAALLAADTRPALVAAARALDRVLLSGAYVVPLFYFETDHLAVHRDIRLPRKTPVWGFVEPPSTLPLVWWRKAP